MVKYSKKYSYNYYKPKGKYYTSRQISNMLKNWGKYKLNVTCFVKYYQNAWYWYFPGMVDQVNWGNIANIVYRSTTFDVIKKEWTFYRITGVCFECIPTRGEGSYVINQGVYTLYNGSIAFGLFSSNKNALATFNEIIECDKCVQLDKNGRQRVYFPIRERDYVRFPTQASIANMVTAFPLPLTFHVNAQEINADSDHTLYPAWQIRCTFYVTCKDKLL